MTIENTASSAAKPSPHAHASAGKAAAAKGPGGTAAGDAPGMGFLAILGALGGADGGDGSDASLGANLASTDPLALGLPGADGASGLPPTGADLGTDGQALPVAAPEQPFDAAFLLQQNLQWAQPGVGQALATEPNRDSATHAVGVTDGAVAAMAASGTSGEGAGFGAADAASRRPLAGEARLRAAAGASELAGAANAGGDAAQGADGAALSTSALQHRAAHLGRHSDGTAPSTDSVSATRLASAGGDQPQAKEPKLAPIAPPTIALQQAAQPTEPTPVPWLARQDKARNESTTAGSKTSEGPLVSLGLGASSPELPSALGASPAAMAPDMQRAEQVHFWVSQHLQSAEMKLDGLGQSPVEVRISVQGNEAQIAFLSDEAQTRGMLEGAGSQLKDLLQREGMVLTGVSVGTSDRGDASANERRGRTPPRQTVLAPLQPVDAAAPRVGGPRLASGRAVDLFV